MSERRQFQLMSDEEKTSLVESKLGFSIDRTRAFTEQEQSAISKLPPHEWEWAMRRPDSDKHMSADERQKHYKSKNYPKVEYKSFGEMRSK